MRISSLINRPVIWHQKQLQSSQVMNKKAVTALNEMIMSAAWRYHNIKWNHSDENGIATSSMVRSIRNAIAIDVGSVRQIF